MTVWETKKRRISTKSPTFLLMLCFCEQLHFPPVFSTTTPFVFLLLYLIPVNYFLFSPFLCHSLPSFKPEKHLCLLLTAPWGLFHKGKAQSFLYYIPNQNRANNPQCLRMGSPIFSLRQWLFLSSQALRSLGEGH